MRPESLYSLHALTISVRDPESRRLAEEAVAAYNGGAYRSAILSIWVAVCADIISKIRELAIGGDKNAATKIADLQMWISRNNLPALQAFEGSLIELASKEFEMLLPHEVKDLLRLREDRHFCAHPALVSEESLFSPTAELTRTHIAHAILHLLSHAPVQGKSLLTRFENDLLGGSFPSSREEIERALRKTYLQHAKTSAIRSLTRALTKSLVGSESYKYKGKEKTVAATLATIGKIFPAIYEEELPSVYERLGRELGDSDILRICYYINADSKIWQWLGESGQLRVLAKIDSTPLNELGASCAFLGRHIEAVGNRILSKLKSSADPDFLELWIKRAPCAAFVPTALSFYGDSSSFASAEENGEKLLLPYTEFFSAADIKALSESIRENKYSQILAAKKTSSILSQAFDSSRRLLPESKVHWQSIADQIIQGNFHTEYQYPQFLKTLSEAGILIPDLPEEKVESNAPLF